MRNRPDCKAALKTIATCEDAQVNPHKGNFCVAAPAASPNRRDRPVQDALEANIPLTPPTRFQTSGGDGEEPTEDAFADQAPIDCFALIRNRFPPVEGTIDCLILLEIRWAGEAANITPGQRRPDAFPLLETPTPYNQ